MLTLTKPTFIHSEPISIEAVASPTDAEARTKIFLRKRKKVDTSVNSGIRCILSLCGGCCLSAAFAMYKRFHCVCRARCIVCGGLSWERWEKREEEKRHYANRNNRKCIEVHRRCCCWLAACHHHTYAESNRSTRRRPHRLMGDTHTEQHFFPSRATIN